MKNKKILILIIISSFTFSQNIVDINYFYNSNFSHPCITFDATNNTAYYLNEYNPLILTDFEILDVNINASSLAPMGTYYMNNFYQQFVYDSVSSNSFEHNRGDYAYYENTILMSSKNDNLATLLMAQGRSQPVYDISDSEVNKGNTLQNYFFNINKFYPFNDKNHFYFSASTMYHVEDINIPGDFSDSYYSRISDSYMYGLTANLNLDKLNFDFSASSQLLNGNHYLDSDIVFDESTDWFNFDATWDYNQYFSILSSFNSKYSSIEWADVFNKTDLYEGSIGGELNYKNFTAQLLFNSITFTGNNNNNKLNFYLSYNLEKLNLIFSAHKKTQSFINRGLTDEYGLESAYPINIFDIYSINIQYKNKMAMFALEPYLLSNHYTYIQFPDLQIEEITGLKGSFAFKNDYIISRINGTVYYSDDLLPLNSYLNYSILFSPIINQKRFRPFIGFSGSYMDLNSIGLINPASGGYSSYYEDFRTKKENLFSFEMGFIVKGFKLTYSMINPFGEEILFTFDDSYDSIRSFSNLKINWQFLD